jgi:hypothetical protein
MLKNSKNQINEIPVCFTRIKYNLYLKKKLRL